MSPYADRLVFKGGTLLAYIIETDRRTSDLDFSAIDRLQGHWAPFIRKMKLKGAPVELKDVIAVINKMLRKSYGSK